MKTAILIIIGLALAIVASAILFGSRYYGVIESVQDVTALNSEDELFVFIGHTTGVVTDTRFRLLAKELTSVLLVPEDINDDLLVVHFKEGKLSRFDLKGYGHSGSSFVYRGQVYWGRSHDHTPSTWKWDGSKLIPLSEAEASQVDNDVKSASEAIRTEGWKETSFKGAQMICYVKGRGIKIFQRAESIAGVDRVRVYLAESGNTNAPEPVIDVLEGYLEINKKEYLKLKSQTKR